MCVCVLCVVCVKETCRTIESELAAILQGSSLTSDEERDEERERDRRHSPRRQEGRHEGRHEGRRGSKGSPLISVEEEWHQFKPFTSSSSSSSSSSSPSSSFSTTPEKGQYGGRGGGHGGGQHASVTESFSNYHNSHMPWCMKDWAFQPLRVIAPVTMVSEEVEYK